MTWFVDLVRVLSSCTSTMMILSPLPSVYAVYRSRATGLASITPLVSMLANCHLWMLYEYLDDNIFPIFATFVFGDIASLCYIAVFYRFSADRAFAHQLFAGFGLVLAATMLYAVLGGLGYTNQPRGDVTNVVGYIAIVASVMLYGSPFEQLGLVFRHRSGVFIPITMVVAGAINNGMWVLYASLTSDWLVFGLNVFTCSICLIQIAVYVAFLPATHPLPVTLDLASKDLEAALPGSPVDLQGQDVAGL